MLVCKGHSSVVSNRGTTAYEPGSRSQGLYMPRLAAFDEPIEELFLGTCDLAVTLLNAPGDPLQYLEKSGHAYAVTADASGALRNRRR
jgi:hypothetical protein